MGLQISGQCQNVKVRKYKNDDIKTISLSKLPDSLFGRYKDICDNHLRFLASKTVGMIDFSFNN